MARHHGTDSDPFKENWVYRPGRNAGQGAFTAYDTIRSVSV